MNVEDIYVAERHRRDIGSIDSLVASIEDVGLLQPIVVSHDGRLIAGGRRLEAVKRLGWTEVPTRIAESLSDAAGFLKAERDENVQRKDFTASEVASIGSALEALYRPEAEARSAANGFGTNVPRGTPVEAQGRTADKVGEALGLSGRTYARIKTVAADAADGSLPEGRREAAQAAIDAMDDGAPVTPTYEMYRAENVQPSVADLPNPRAVTVGKAHAERVRRLVASLTGQAAGFASLDVNAIRAVLDEDERKRLSQDLGAAIAGLRQLNRDLENGR